LFWALGYSGPEMAKLFRIHASAAGAHLLKGQKRIKVFGQVNVILWAYRTGLLQLDYTPDYQI
jgi:DNA-binding CsgD family transcriptional regulator